MPVSLDQMEKAMTECSLALSDYRKAHGAAEQAAVAAVEKQKAAQAKLAELKSLLDQSGANTVPSPQS